MTPLTVQLDWKPNAQFAGLLLAEQLGWYRQAGLDLTIVPWQSHTNPVQALDRAPNVIASTEDNLLIQARVAGKPFKAIGVMMQYSGIGWMALAASGIRSVRDFKGKRIGIHGDGATALQIALSQAGLSRTEVEVVDVGFNYDELLQSGDFDAIQCFVIVEPLELAAKGFELTVIPAYESGYLVYSQVLATTEQLIASEPDALTRFLKVSFDGWRQAIQTPQAVGQLIAQHYLPEADPVLQQQMLVAMQPILCGEVGLERLGWMEIRRWQQSIDYLLAEGIITQPLPAAEVMTEKLIEAAYAE